MTLESPGFSRGECQQESQMEYARPILEMTGLAVQYNATFLIIHHTNREGGVRGTTAIRNAVSEVWTLTKDNSQTATPYDRLLTIDKSRSRSSGKKYRLMFNPEDLSFTFLGEEAGPSIAAETSAKDALLDFFTKNPSPSPHHPITPSPHHPITPFPTSQ